MSAPSSVAAVAGATPVAVAGRTRGRRRRLDPVFWAAMVWLVVIVGAALLAPVLPLGNADDSARALAEPVFAPPMSPGHLLGTDTYGLDLLARTVYGARTSLAIALVAVVVGTTVGGLIGIVAGYLRGFTDSVVGVLANALLAVPPLVLLIALGSVLSPGIRNIGLALALLTIPSMVRVARATTIGYAGREFVWAARAMGATGRRLVLRELLPNVVPPLLSLAVVMVSMLIVAEASLSFLGLGIKPPEPTWGNMIAEGQDGVMEQHPFIVVIPGVCLFLTVFAFNLLGERAQQRLNPKAGRL